MPPLSADTLSFGNFENSENAIVNRSLIKRTCNASNKILLIFFHFYTAVPAETAWNSNRICTDYYFFGYSSFF